jgi:hypothetical protein
MSAMTPLDQPRWSLERLGLGYLDLYLKCQRLA